MGLILVSHLKVSVARSTTTASHRLIGLNTTSSVLAVMPMETRSVSLWSKRTLTGFRLTAELRLSLEYATARYEKNLDLAAEYLSGRGFTEETARSFRLGVVDDPLAGDESFAGRLSIPYITQTGVVDIRFRCLQLHACKEHGHPKYLGVPGRPLRLFNVSDFLFAEDFICVTEGELDTMVLHQLGLPSVASPGTGGWKPHFSRIFEDYQRVYLFADGDDPGRKFGMKLAAEIGAIVIGMPEGTDVNSVFLDEEYGEEFLLGKVEGERN